MKVRLTKRSTALHEAAHAVVADYLGYTVNSIHLRANRTGRVVHLAPPVRGARPMPPRMCPIEQSMIALAGDVATYRARLLSRRLMSDSDTRALQRLALSRYSVFTVMRPATERLLTKLWPKVRRLAGDLERRRWPVLLRRAECERLLREVPR